jgi:hypothetical protein
LVDAFDCHCARRVVCGVRLKSMNGRRLLKDCSGSLHRPSCGPGFFHEISDRQRKPRTNSSDDVAAKHETNPNS